MCMIEDIAQQQEQLKVWRRTLESYLHRLGLFGSAHAPPEVSNGIGESRAAIRRIKATLRGWDVRIDDHPDDEAGRSLVQAQAGFAALPHDTIPDVAPLPFGSRMPLNHNPLFVGRETELNALAIALIGDGTTATGQVAAIVGLAGIGKTNLATEFVHRYGKFFTGGVFWLSFAEPNSIPLEIAVCGRAGAMHLHNFTELTIDDQVARVRREWQQSIPRLLVYDNCEDEALLTQWRPTSGACRVLVTSRRAGWSRTLGVTALPLGVLHRNESITLLQQHRPNLDTADADMLAAELGDLPLALHLAGSYLEIYRSNSILGAPTTFLRELRDVRVLAHPALQGEDTTPSPTNHLLHVGRTFALGYERLNPTDEADLQAIRLLARAACLAPGEIIPHDLLLATLDLPSDDHTRVKLAAKGLGHLVNLGLLDQETTGALRIHRLVAAFTSQSEPDPAAQQMVERVILDAATSINGAGYPAAMQPLRAHLRHVTETAWDRADTQVAALCTALGNHLSDLGSYGAARSYYEHTLAIHEKVLGSEHPDTARSLNNLAILLGTQGSYAAARHYLERALAIREKVLGPEHPDTARSLNGLAILLKTQGSYAAARHYLERALAIREKVLGPEHPDTALSLNNMATLLRDLGDYTAAHSYYERALTIREKILGPEHLHIAFSLSGLASLLRDQGDYATARSYYERALAIREKILGPEHPDTALSLNGLASVLHAQGDYATARSYYERALAIREGILGPEHPDTVMILNNLTTLLQAEGELVARPYVVAEQKAE